MTASRRIGLQTRQICELLEKIGPSGTAEIGRNFPGVESSNLRKRLNKAVDYKLLTVCVGEGHLSNFSLFSAVVDWKEIADKRAAQPKVSKPKPRKKPDVPSVVTQLTGVSSVFQMGAM